MKNSANLWQDLVSAAVVGTHRNSSKIPPASGKLGKFLSRLEASDREGALLGAAAARVLHRIAGKKPLKDERSLPYPCESDSQPCCSPRAADFLNWILIEKYPQMLPEWLQFAATAGVRVPENYLPAILEIGREQPEMRSAILPVLGKRGRWLAAQNPDWNYAAGEDDKTIWETGSLDARILLLQRLGAENPDVIRERVAAIWAEEAAENKAAILETFKIGLSMADEPFLETCLDEINPDVRRVAADLLARLPSSRLVARMIPRVSPLMIFTKEKEFYIDIDVMVDCDDEMVRDGINPEAPDTWGEDSWYLIQLLAAIPPSFWSKSWGISPAEIVPKISDIYEGWDLAVMSGWAGAAARYGDADLAEALLRAYAIASELYYDNCVDEDFNIQALIDVLPLPRRDALMVSFLQSEEGLDFNSRELLPLCRYPWSIELSRALLEAVRRYIATGETQHLEATRAILINVAAPVISLDIIEETSALLAEVKEHPDWAAVLHELLSALEFRRKMITM